MSSNDNATKDSISAKLVPFKTPDHFFSMEGKVESIPRLKMPPPLSNIVKNDDGGEENNDDDEEAIFTLEEDILKILGIKPTFDPLAPILDLNGVWTLDVDRSEPMEDYLLALSVPQLARQASSKLAHVLVINQTSTTFQITRLSKLGSNTKNFVIGVPQMIKQFKGEAQMTVLVGKGIVQTQSIFENVPMEFKGSLRDSRCLIDNGRTMKVTLELSLILSGAKRVVTRYFNASDESVNYLISSSPKNRK